MFLRVLAGILNRDGSICEARQEWSLASTSEGLRRTSDPLAKEIKGGDRNQCLNVSYERRLLAKVNEHSPHHIIQYVHRF